MCEISLYVWRCYSCGNEWQNLPIQVGCPSMQRQCGDCGRIQGRMQNREFTCNNCQNPPVGQVQRNQEREVHHVQRHHSYGPINPPTRPTSIPPASPSHQASHRMPLRPITPSHQAQAVRRVPLRDITPTYQGFHQPPRRGPLRPMTPARPMTPSRQALGQSPRQTPSRRPAAHPIAAQPPVNFVAQQREAVNIYGYNHPPEGERELEDWELPTASVSSTVFSFHSHRRSESPE